MYVSTYSWEKTMLVLNNRFSTKFPSRKLVSVIAKDKYPYKLHWKTVTQMSDHGFNLLSPVGASLVLLAATNLMIEYIWLC